jgi:hypothetical protein
MWQNHAIDIVAIFIDRSRRSEALGRVPERKLCFRGAIHSAFWSTSYWSQFSCIEFSRVSPSAAREKRKYENLNKLCMLLDTG